MLQPIKAVYESPEFTQMMADSWFMNFVIKPENSKVVRTLSKVILPELTDLAWVYISVANIFEDKLATAERIVLGYLLAQDPDVLLRVDMADRDRRQLLNALLAIKQYKLYDQSDVMLPLDMATSALILKSAMYRCVKTMSMVGLTTSATTVEEQLREPISDSYTLLYQAALDQLPPAAREEASLSLSRDELKKLVIMPDYYGSSEAIKRIPKELHEPYLRAKEELIPGHMRHLEWGRAAGAVLTEREVTHPQWTCSLTGRNIGYICEDAVHADISLADGATFSVSKSVEGKAYHLPLIANTVHSADSSLLVAWYKFAEDNDITTFTTHDAINCTANNLNQARQVIAEQIVLTAYHSPVMSMAKELDLPLPVIGDFTEWVTNFKAHGFMS
jgi:hypothetical protein